MVNLFNKGISGDAEAKLKEITGLLAGNYYHYIYPQGESKKPIDDWVDAENTITSFVSEHHFKEKLPEENITGNHLESMMETEFDYYKGLLPEADDFVLTGIIAGNILLSKIYGGHARNATSRQLENPENILEVKQDGKIAYFLTGKTFPLPPFSKIIGSLVGEGRFSHSVEMLGGSEMYAFKMPSAVEGREKIIGLSTIYSDTDRGLYNVSLFTFDYGDKVDTNAAKYLTDIFGIANLTKLDAVSDKDKSDSVKEYLSSQLKSKLI